MTEAELMDFVEHRLGTMRGSVRRELEALAGRLRPDERLVAVAVASRSVLVGRACVIAATDRRLLLAWSSSECEEIGYDALISVTDDLAAGELSLVTGERVHTLTVAPTPGAAELVAALTARIGEDRMHARAGGAEARRTMGAVAGGARTACALVVCFLLNAGFGAVVESGPADDRVSDSLSQGGCLDIGGRSMACDSPGAFFVVLGPRDMRRCPPSSPTIVRSIASFDPERRDLSRWCVDFNER